METGVAYVFDAASGSLVHTLANPTPGYFDSFGNAVAISGNTVIVGAQWEGDRTPAVVGDAYLFDATRAP